MMSTVGAESLSPSRDGGFALRRTVPAFVLAVAVAGLLYTGGTFAAAPPRPNVLLITVDTLRADHLSCYGYALPTTPRIDELARQGVQFEDAHCQIPKTNPSLASLWTGLYPENHKDLTLRLTLSRAHPVLAERLRAAGYRTSAIVGQYNLVRQSGFDRGMQDYFDEFPEELPGRVPPGHFQPGTEKRAAELTDRALGWLRKAPKQPFFLWIHYVDPHAAYDPPPPYDHSFSESRYSPATLRREQIHDQAFDPTHFTLAYYMQRYDGEIRYLDDQIGRLLDDLRARGLDDNTMIVLTADHGEYMGEADGARPGKKSPAVPYFSHGTTLTDAETHVPLLWKLPPSWSPRSKPRRVRGPVEMVDITPTLLDILNLPAISGDGRSLAASLRPVRQAAAGETRAYSYSFESNSVALATPRWKLVDFPSGSLAAYFTGRGGFRSIEAGGTAHLYDRARPGRAVEIESIHPDVAARLRAELIEHLRSAPGPRNTAFYPLNFPWGDSEHLKRLRSLGYL